MEQNQMNQEWDARQAIVGVINEKLEGVEISEQAKTAVVDYLIGQRMIKLDTVADLGQFSHYETEQLPYRTLLINHLLVYITEHTVSVRQHQDAYDNHLEENDLYDDEISYEDFLVAQGLTDEGAQNTYYHINTARVGDIFFGFIKEQKHLEQRATFVADKLQTIKTVVGDNFLTGLQL